MNAPLVYTGTPADFRELALRSAPERAHWLREVAARLERDPALVIERTESFPVVYCTPAEPRHAPTPAPH